MKKWTLNYIVFHEGNYVNGLRFIPALLLSVIITAVGFLSISYFLYQINYPGFEKWLW